MKGSEVKWKII